MYEPYFKIIIECCVFVVVFTVMFYGHVCSLLQIASSMLVRPGFPGVYNPTNGTVPEMLWCTSVNGFVKCISGWCIRDYCEYII